MGMVCFARLCKDDVIKIARTEEDPRCYLSGLKRQFGPIREVTWLNEDEPPGGRNGFYERFKHLHVLYRDRTGQFRSEVYRADPELIEFIATLDPATATRSTADHRAACLARWQAEFERHRSSVEGAGVVYFAR
jgi:hypothetical protein